MLFYGIFVYFLLFIIINAQQYRSLDGTNNNLYVPNAGASSVQYLNYKNAKELFADSTTASMLTCPHNYKADGLPTIDKCTDILPEGTFPLPRCISNLADGIRSTQAQQLDMNFIDSFQSKRKSSHMMTFWADFISFDIACSKQTEEILNDAILIPNDDNTYLSENTQQITQISQPTLPFARTYNISSRGIINVATAFVDGSSIYGINETRLNELRDPNNKCKMLLIYGKSGDSVLGYPPKDASGSYIYGLIPQRGTQIFVDFIFTVFLREHNRRCDNLYSIYGDKWDDETYFQEARKWVIALIQKINYLEYLSILMGVPLPEFTEYDPSLVVGVDSTFITTTMRYGHSEVSDKFIIVDQNGETATTFTLQEVKIPGLLESFGVPNIAVSLALQRQEEIDIFYSDFMRAFRGPNPIPVDIASIDHLRVRDRGIPLYNDVRELYGFTRAKDFNDITQNAVVQERLKSLYSNVDEIETLVGGLAEDHYSNSNFGPLFQKSMQEQWTLLRDGDRFWFESPDAGFTRKEIEEIRNTTWRDVILRNSPENTILPDNLWFVQPRKDFSTPKVNENVDVDGYSKDNFFEISKTYSIKWKIEEPFIYFKMRVESDNAWFGLGFNPLDDGMLGADFLIAYSDNGDIRVGNYKSNGYQPPIYGKEQFVEKIKANIGSGFMEVQVRRPIRAPGMIPMANDTSTVIFAWNPNSNALSYHGGNRGKATINFFNSGVSTSSKADRFALLMHGVWMFTHRNLQVIGSVGVFTFGTAALAISNEQRRTPHKILGLTIYAAIFLQLGLGILSIWARSFLESSNRGISRAIKFIHFILGVMLMMAAAVNVYLGIQAYGVPKIWEFLYLAWVGILCVAVAGIEYWYSFKNRVRCFNDPEMDNKGIIRKCIPDGKYDRLQVFSWSEVNQRVVQGAKLVVAEDLLFDIRRWINVHPGGARVLNRVIGTDITDDFYGKNSSELYKDVEGQPKKPALLKGGLVNCLDLLNSKSFVKGSGHQHSRFATETLASMVIGRIENSEKDKDVLLEIEKKDTSTNANSQILKRYTLIKKETITGRGSEHPVRKFTFRVNNQDESLPKFLPGDYLEILSLTKGQVVVRPYTALQEPSRKDFSIIVKIYKDGLMSKHLDRQLLGFEIKMRGPFGIHERIGGEKSIQNSTVNHILLNPNSEDGCWDILFMICGGTGITPMIQLIEYHLENLKDGRNFQLFLLFANQRISDIIYPNYLDELVKNSNGKLNITYFLSKPPSGWKYLHGRLNLGTIFTWLSKHYIPNELNTHDDGNTIKSLISPTLSIISPILISSIIDNHVSSSASSKSKSFMKFEEQSKNSEDPSSSQQQHNIHEQRRYIKALESDPTALKIVVCGPPSMMKSVSDILLDELGISREKTILII